MFKVSHIEREEIEEVFETFEKEVVDFYFSRPQSIYDIILKVFDRVAPPSVKKRFFGAEDATGMDVIEKMNSLDCLNDSNTAMYLIYFGSVKILSDTSFKMFDTTYEIEEVEVIDELPCKMKFNY